MSDIDYRAFLESTPLVPWEADAQTWSFTYVGPQAVDLLGFPVEDWYEPSFWENRIHPSDRSSAISTCMKLSAEGGGYEFEYRMVRSDGAVIWVNDVVSVEMGDAGPITLRGLLIDITEQKALQQAVEDNEQRLQRLLQAAPDALLLLHADGTILQCNRRAEELFGFSLTELLGSPVERLVPERFAGTLANHRRALAEASRLGPMVERLDLLARRLDGSEIPVEISLSPIEHEEKVQILASVRDLTSRKHVESELRARQQLLQDMANALPALISFIDKDQRYRYVNDNYAAWFDVDPTRIEGKLVRDVLGERLYDRLRAGIVAVLSGEHVRYELEFPAPDGSGRPVELTLSPQLDDEGGVSGYVVVIFDITDRVATMGELAASIAHEFNQP